MGVETITFEAPVYNMWLSTDTPRAFSPYSYDSTQHGRFFIRESSSSRSDTEADYVMTHFSLEMRADGSGCVSRRRLRAAPLRPALAHGLQPRDRRYEQSLLLKQGAYNYQYLAVPSGRHAARPHPWRAISIRPSTNTP